MFVGALASWQGIDVVLSAAQSAGWPANVDLVIAGDGKERGQVEAASRTNPHVRWLGTIPYMEAATLVSESIAALVPMTDVPRSRFGLSPLKMYEAMACGVPVIASDLPGPGDIVRAHDCGIAFAPGNADALARAVAELVGNPVEASRMGARGRAAAVSAYSWDCRARQTEQVLLQVARARAAGHTGGSVGKT